MLWANTSGEARPAIGRWLTRWPGWLRSQRPTALDPDADQLSANVCLPDRLRRYSEVRGDMPCATAWWSVPVSGGGSAHRTGYVRRQASGHVTSCHGGGFN